MLLQVMHWIFFWMAKAHAALSPRSSSVQVASTRVFRSQHSSEATHCHPSTPSLLCILHEEAATPSQKIFLNFQTHLPTRTQRPIEPSHTIHILPILRLLLLSHARHIVSLHLCILRRRKPGESHRSLHRRDLRVRVHFHIVCGVFRIGGDGSAVGGVWGAVCGRKGWFAGWRRRFG